MYKISLTKRRNPYSWPVVRVAKGQYVRFPGVANQLAAVLKDRNILVSNKKFDGATLVRGNKSDNNPGRNFITTGCTTYDSVYVNTYVCDKWLSKLGLSKSKLYVKFERKG